MANPVRTSSKSDTPFADDSGNLLARRSSVYERLRTLESLKQSFPLLSVFEIGQKNLERLQNSVTNFILASLRLSGEKSYPYRSDFLTAYGRDIAALPNITPNGACYPKRETVFEYNIMHRDFVTACRECGVLQHLRMLTPLTLRVMFGDTTPDNEARPFSSAKPHSDAWIGHTSDGIASLMVMGDVDGTRVEFFEPTDPSPDFFDELTDYDHGRKRFRDLQPYPAQPKAGNLYLFDHLALHQTVRAQGGTRLSFGFGYVVDSSASRSADANPVKFNYLDRDEWAGIGSTSMQLVDESMADLAKLYGMPDGQVPKPRYAPFRTISLWPEDSSLAD